LLLPTSAFFVATKLSEDQFITTLKQEKFAHLATSVKAEKSSFPTFVRYVNGAIIVVVVLLLSLLLLLLLSYFVLSFLDSALSALLHAEVIMHDDKSASLFGKSIQEHKLCIYTKSVSGQYSVDIKCTDNAIAESLINEVNEFWK
jgi:hypothetical protein